MSLKPIIKWAGGKSRMLHHLTDNLVQFDGVYYEPFIGGGALFLHLRPSRWVINDLNPVLVSLWEQIRDDPERLCDSISSLKTQYLNVEDKKEFYLKKRIEFNKTPIPALFIFLNKTCFNGLYRVNKSGEFNVPWNNNENPCFPSKDEIFSISQFMNETEGEIRYGSWKDAIKGVGKDDFIYFDPPYYPEKVDSFTSYTTTVFGVEEQVELSSKINELSDKGIYVMMSNANVTAVHELYLSYVIREVNLSRSICRDKDKRGKRACEVIITNWFIFSLLT